MRNVGAFKEIDHFDHEFKNTKKSQFLLEKTNLEFVKHFSKQHIKMITMFI
jgi:hypothetical protein